MKKDARIFIAGHTGMVGSAFVRHLQKNGYSNLVTRTHAELDLTDQPKVREFFLTEPPEYVILAAGKVGGIMANNNYPAEFIYDNLQILTNVIHYSWQAKVKKLLLIGSACIYPKVCPQPMKEELLLTGPVEPTSEGTAIAKIAGIRMCQSYHRQYGTNFISLVAASVYGPGDNFDPETSHLVPGLIGKFHEAKESGKKTVTLWGTGMPRREYMHVDDLSAAGVFLMDNHDDSEIINVGAGEDFSVKEYAEIISRIVGFTGEIRFDASRPDGAPRKLLDSAKMRALKWAPRIPLEQGLRETYAWYREQLAARTPPKKG